MYLTVLTLVVGAGFLQITHQHLFQGSWSSPMPASVNVTRGRDGSGVQVVL